ncbi:ATPase, T2SS/T4P/T4SS family [Paenibacillus taichungensis]|uniref:ATPase, T2SS/T4P/T4SS family n=1 Tax=Paenibacillus taichungensis TaxID=484184 RepID=UPI0035E2B1CD
MATSGIYNFLFIVLIISGLIAFLLFLLWKKPKRPKTDEALAQAEKYSIPILVEYTKVMINEFVNTNLMDMGLSGEEYERRQAIVNELRNAMRNAVSGEIRDKLYLKEHIEAILEQDYGLNEKNIDLVIPFTQPERLTSQDIFDILMNHFKKKHGYKALSFMIEKYNLAKPKHVIEAGKSESYVITEEEIKAIYRKEIRGLEFKDKLDIIVQRVYQLYKGFGVADEIRDMNIDGLSGGVSGAPSKMTTVEHVAELVGQMRSTKRGNNSLWIFYKGKTIHLSFLEFETDLELKRVAQNIYKHNSPGPLTETSGFVVNDMADGSRVVVVRPPFAESWAFWVRKFDIPNLSIENLIPDTHGQADLARDMIKNLMKGAQTTAYTGKTGAGKTSLMMTSIGFMYAFLNLRTVELILELNLRQLYPERNSIAFRELPTIPGQEALNLNKKTDTDVSILGEVASQSVATWMIQMTQVGSLFTIFSHHAVTTRQLIKWFRDALLAEQIMQDERLAEEQVAEAIKWDIHMTRDQKGNRYIERITEITLVQYDDSFFENTNDYEQLMKESIRRKHGPIWKERNILEYKDGGYVAVNPISPERIHEMRGNMLAEDQIAFDAFINEHWGGN